MRLVVLGGGLSGMAAAHELMDKAEITILEKESYLGGLAGSFEMDGQFLPIFYHHIFPHDKHTLKYLSEFGMRDTISWKRVKVGIVADDKVWDFAQPHELLRFAYLSPLGRLRYGWFGLRTLFTLNAASLDASLDAKTWLLRAAGKEITEKIFVPLYAENKFNIPLDKISAKQFAMRLVNKEVLGKFGYPSVGLHHFVSEFERHLQKKVDIKKRAVVKQIDLEKKEVTVGSEVVKYDALINTIAVPEFLSIAKKLPTPLVKRYQKVKYCPAVEVAFATRHHLTNHYWLNLFRQRFGLLFQHSNLHDAYPFKFHWALRYGGSENDLHLSDEQIFNEYIGNLKKTIPIGEILWYRVFRTKYAEPIFTSDYVKIMPHNRSGLAGLYNAGTATVFPRIRNMDASIQSGERAAQFIASDFDIS
ncbi:MAG: FAD-dependent oxidoreductase [Candidatus Thorarchaeota archaeon]|nr:FAD-dependent oxidoreductase [Candidatus Thorarchaeota archaeon]